MATTDMSTVVTLCGLHQPLGLGDMKESSTTYNGLQRIETNTHVDMDHVKGLLEIIVRHDQLGRFGIHLIHRHDPIANESVRLESNIGLVPGKWNMATPIDSLNLSNIHGVVFKFVPKQNQLVPFEFCEGPSPVSAGDVNIQFVQDFTNYLTKNSLADTFALEFVHPAEGGQPEECTAEIEVNKLGTVVLPISAVNAKEFLPTGWPGAAVPLNDSEPPPGQTWAKKVNEYTLFF